MFRVSYEEKFNKTRATCQRGCVAFSWFRGGLVGWPWKFNGSRFTLGHGLLAIDLTIQGVATLCAAMARDYCLQLQGFLRHDPPRPAPLARCCLHTIRRSKYLRWVREMCNNHVSVQVRGSEKVVWLCGRLATWPLGQRAVVRGTPKSPRAFQLPLHPYGMLFYFLGRKVIHIHTHTHVRTHTMYMTHTIDTHLLLPTPCQSNDMCWSPQIVMPLKWPPLSTNWESCSVPFPVCVCLCMCMFMCVCAYVCVFVRVLCSWKWMRV